MDGRLVFGFISLIDKIMAKTTFALDADNIQETVFHVLTAGDNSDHLGFDQSLGEGHPMSWWQCTIQILIDSSTRISFSGLFCHVTYYCTLMK